MFNLLMKFEQLKVYKKKKIVNNLKLRIKDSHSIKFFSS